VVGHASVPAVGGRRLEPYREPASNLFVKLRLLAAVEFGRQSTQHGPYGRVGLQPQIFDNPYRHDLMGFLNLAVVPLGPGVQLLDAPQDLRAFFGALSFRYGTLTH
jgi:hypothetical protein